MNDRLGGISVRENEVGERAADVDANKLHSCSGRCCRAGTAPHSCDIHDAVATAAHSPQAKVHR
jgi:hypothetical protein